MVILVEMTDAILKILGRIFLALVALIVCYSFGELYMQVPSAFSSWDLGVCGVLAALGALCFKLRNLLGYNPDEDDGC